MKLVEDYPLLTFTLILGIEVVVGILLWLRAGSRSSGSRLGLGCLIVAIPVLTILAAIFLLFFLLVSH